VEIASRVPHARIVRSILSGMVPLCRTRSVDPEEIPMSRPQPGAPAAGPAETLPIGVAGRGRARILDAHDDAVRDFATAVRALSEADWGRSPAGLAWTRGQIAVHVALSLEAFARDLAGGPTLQPRANRFWQTLFRWVVLPHVLFHRSFPIRARSPRELRPEAAVPDRESVATRVEAAWAGLRAAIQRADSRRRVMHPYFGPISVWRAVRFSAVHTDHHRRQLEG
jgi:hypothetical protein